MQDALASTKPNFKGQVASIHIIYLHCNNNCNIPTWQ